MKWVCYTSSANEQVAGVVVDGIIYSSGRTFDNLLVSDGGDLASAGAKALHSPKETLPLTEVHLRAPVGRVPALRDYMAFEEHVINAGRAMGRELDPRWYDAPVFYFSNPAAVVGPYDNIPVAPGSNAFDFELEIAAVIGTPGSDLTPAQAEQAIAGYVLMSDWSARDLQQAEMAHGLGPAKGKDTATGLGPFLVTPDELEDRRSGLTFDLAMSASVNGKVYTTGNVKDMIWSFGQLVAYASRGTTIQIGDVIGSGTVGTGCILELSLVHGADEYPWLQPGDTVTLDIERLGTMTSNIVEGRAVVPLIDRTA